MLAMLIIHMPHVGQHLAVCLLSKDISKMYAIVHTYPGRTSTHNYVIVEAERKDKVETWDALHSFTVAHSHKQSVLFPWPPWARAGMH
jgi:hypothetical protein